MVTINIKKAKSMQSSQKPPSKVDDKKTLIVTENLGKHNIIVSHGNSHPLGEKCKICDKIKKDLEWVDKLINKESKNAMKVFNYMEGKK